MYFDIHSLAKLVLEYSFKDTCIDNFVVFSGKYSRWNFLLWKLQYLKFTFFEQSAPPNISF